MYAFCVASRIWTNMAYEGERDLIIQKGRPTTLAKHHGCWRTEWRFLDSLWNNKNTISTNPHIPQSQPNSDPNTTELSVQTIWNLPRITHSGKVCTVTGALQMIKPKNLLPKSVTSAIGRWIPGLHVACKHLRSHVFKLGLMMAGSKRNNQISMGMEEAVQYLDYLSIKKWRSPIFQDTCLYYISSHILISGRFWFFNLRFWCVTVGFGGYRSWGWPNQLRQQGRWNHISHHQISLRERDPGWKFSY